MFGVADVLAWVTVACMSAGGTASVSRFCISLSAGASSSVLVFFREKRSDVC